MMSSAEKQMELEIVVLSGISQIQKGKCQISFGIYIKYVVLHIQICIYLQSYSHIYDIKVECELCGKGKLLEGLRTGKGNGGQYSQSTMIYLNKNVIMKLMPLYNEYV